MYLLCLLLICLSAGELSKGYEIETDTVVTSSRYHYLITKPPWDVGTLYACPEKYRDIYRCYDNGRLRQLLPYKYVEEFFFSGRYIRPPKKICPYLRISSRKGDLVKLNGYCLKYCTLCYCYLKDETVAVVYESDLDDVYKNKGCDDENELDDDDDEDKDEETTIQEPASVDDALRTQPTTPLPKPTPSRRRPTTPEQEPPRPEPTTPRPDSEDDELQFFDEPGKGRKQPKENEKLVAEQSRGFALDLLKAMRDEYEGENLVASPSAVLAILKIFLKGAGSYTKRNLDEVIGEPLEVQNIMIDPRKGASIEMKTALMYAQQYELDENIENELNDDGVETIPVSFNRQIQAAREINEWLSNGLNKRTDIFEPEDLLSTDLVVLNTLTFSGKFEKPFVTESIDEFLTLDGSIYNISMMSSEEGAAYPTMYSKNISATIVDLPYKKSKLKMRVIIPDDGASLKQTEDKLTTEELQEIDEKIRTKNITLKMPKVFYEMKKPMEKPLKRMGLDGLFPEANLEGFFEPRRLYFGYSDEPDGRSVKLGNFFQSVGINITEEGTSVSSNTVAVANLFKDDEIVANKPFLLFIEDSISRQILFFGRIVH